MRIRICDENGRTIKIYENITNPIQVSVIASKHEFWEYMHDVN
jgi:hypothetical protein